jgi:hypothetical protein
MVRSRHPNRRRSGRLGARVKSRTERGERGDREDVLTKGGDGGRRPESGRRRAVDRRPHTQEVRFGRGGFGTVGSTGGASWARGARRLGAKQWRWCHTRTSRGSRAGSGRSSLSLTSIVQKTALLDWQSFGLRNKMLNGKTKRKRRDERDGVLTFGQG